MDSNLRNSVISALKEVYDPEIPINVYDLGLIYEIKIDTQNNVHILMSLTSPTCPTADFIKEMITDSIKSIDKINNVEIELTFEPLWTPDRITKEAKEELGFEEVKEENLHLKKVFDDSNLIEQKICFNCGISEDKIPIISAHYKNEIVGICATCMNKFK